MTTGDSMKFGTAISTCLSKYATFSGRATRSEFWWFYLFTFLINWIAGLVAGNFISLIISLAFVIPLWAAGARRLHDIGRSGWWQLLFITIIGIFVLIYWFVQDTVAEANQYGAYVPPSEA
jgi:uncharacterized membrane protein YhaH (DUF805 family)